MIKTIVTQVTLTGALPVRYPAFPPPHVSQLSPVNLTVSRAVVSPAMAIPNFSQTTLYDAGRGAQTGQSSAVSPSQYSRLQVNRRNS